MVGGTVERIALRLGEELTIPLEENRTTGYSWRFEVPPVLEMVREDHERPPDRIGAGGRGTFRFRARALGRDRLIALYERPWEPEPAGRRDWEIVVER